MQGKALQGKALQGSVIAAPTPAWPRPIPGIAKDLQGRMGHAGTFGDRAGGLVPPMASGARRAWAGAHRLGIHSVHNIPTHRRSMIAYPVHSRAPVNDRVPRPSSSARP